MYSKCIHVLKNINKLYFLWYYTQNGGKYMVRQFGAVDLVG